MSRIASRVSTPNRSALFLLLGLGTILVGCVGEVSAQSAAATPVANAQAPDSRAETREISVILPADAKPIASSGRLLVFLTQRGAGRVTLSPSWFSPEPFFGVDVTDWRPGQTRRIDDQALGFPGPLSELAPGRYRVAAIFDTDFYYPDPEAGVGSYYSQAAMLEVSEDQGFELSLELDQVVTATPWPESRYVRQFEERSELLSDFHGREVLDHAAIILPASYYDEPERRYGVIYRISGFGGHLPQMAASAARSAGSPSDDEVEFIQVLLSGECKWGHHVYADSATNGPRGRALIEEMIPTIDSRFRTVADSRARYVTGHSSGGWSSLWLQVTYPETFGGVWSSSPDPVDFRDYQRTNLYARPAESLYFEADGSRKPLARRGETPVVWYVDFGLMDDVLGRGGQLRSFEAVFSPLDDSGRPALMWDRTSGEVRAEVADAWKPYDISLTLRENWSELREPLAGKLHVVMGTLDTFYLEGATILLKQELEQLESDADIEIVPGADHGSVLTRELRARQKREMTETFLRYFDPQGRPR